jgi:hypothetical protein
MALKHRMEWNGQNWILILDNGPHGRIEMTLDEFVEFSTQFKTDLMIDERPPLDADDPWLLGDN